MVSYTIIHANTRGEDYRASLITGDDIDHAAQLAISSIDANKLTRGDRFIVAVIQTDHYESVVSKYLGAS
jgi:hypothetical protein